MTGTRQFTQAHTHQQWQPTHYKNNKYTNSSQMTNICMYTLQYCH